MELVIFDLPQNMENVFISFLMDQAKDFFLYRFQNAENQYERVERWKGGLVWWKKKEIKLSRWDLEKWWHTMIN